MNQTKINLKSDIIIDSTFTSETILKLIAKNRGVKTSQLENFLSPTSPSVLTASDFGISSVDLVKTIKRIRKAVDNREKILIYGDYDVDGITATAILWRSLTTIGADVTPFIPHREDDGYGIRYDSFNRFKKEKNANFSLILTVDNGIVANQDIKKIIGSGTDVIIIDHHVPDKKLPPAYAIVHSLNTSGAGLSWFLAHQFDPAADMGLAALGVVGDCLPLVGLNRSIVVHGLQSLRLNPSVGIRKLISLSGRNQDSLTSSDLAFVVGPRINAVGRLSNPTDALRLLCADTDTLATRYAQILNGSNQDRQQLQKEGIDNALAGVGVSQDCLLFTADSSYHPGIIGLIASRLCERNYLPAITISIGPEVSKGSCRSIKELNIIETLRETSDLLLELGGHQAAAGFSINTKNIDKFQSKITKIVNNKLKGIELSPSIDVDAQMKLSAATSKNYFTLKKLEPFGMGNQEPLFIFRDLVVVSKRLVGSTGDHLKLKLDDPSTKNIENIGTDAIAFRQGRMDPQIKTGSRIDIVAHLDMNTWNGLSFPQLMVKEIFTV